MYVLNRGGRFMEYDGAFDGEKLRGHYGNMVNLYLEKTATSKNAFTGKYFSGTPGYHPGSGQPGPAHPRRRSGLRSEPHHQPRHPPHEEPDHHQLLADEHPAGEPDLTCTRRMRRRGISTTVTGADLIGDEPAAASGT